MAPDAGTATITRAEQVVSEYIRRYTLPDHIERDDCVSVVIEALLQLEDEYESHGRSLEWQRGRDRIHNYLDREARQTGRAWEQP